MALTGELVDELDVAARHAEAWDALAVAVGRPFCAPAWMLAWWRRAAPKGARLRVALALDGGELAGVAPFYAERTRTGLERLRPLAAGTAARLEPLARPGREQEAAAAFLEVLTRARPRPRAIVLDEIGADSRWPELLASAWPGRRPARVERYHPIPAPTVALEGDYEGWLGSKSSNFRQQFRRTRRKLEGRGAVFRISGADELERDMAAFERLHHARWDSRGGSAALSPEVTQMVRDAVHELEPSGRARLWCIDAEGETISAQLFVAAGDELVYWLGGFDDAWASERPALQTLIAAIEDGFARGERRADLGAGGQDYKYRLADGEDTLEFATIAQRDPLTAAQLAPDRLRRAVSARLSDERRERIRGALCRLRR